MFLTGIGDEAGADFATQIKATKELGWTSIEARNVGSANIHSISAEEFDDVCKQLDESGISICCFSSEIMNWKRQVTDPMEETISLTKQAIERMKRTNTKMIRIMSYAVLKNEDGTDAEDQQAEERFKRMREVVGMLKAEGITPLHENCMNYGGLSVEHTVEMLKNVPDLKLVFDTGNPVFTLNRSAQKPYPMQSAWEFYTTVKEHIEHVHVKDGVMVEDECEYKYPGEGSGDVVRILKDFLGSGYDGGISIEPHLGAVFHDLDAGVDTEKQYNSYIEYGKRLGKIVNG